MVGLFDSLKLGSIEAPNRIVMAPLTRARSNRDGVPNDLMAAYYAQRASAGLIISEATGISREGLGWPNEPVSSSAVTAPDYAHTHEGKMPYAEPRAASERDIERIVDHYAAAARNAIEAGFDGIQIHGANGYLVDQFLRDGANFRSDEFGGSIDNRLRFMTAVLKAVGKAIGMERVGIRFSPNFQVQGVEDAYPVELFKAVAQRLEASQGGQRRRARSQPSQSARSCAVSIRARSSSTAIMTGSTPGRASRSAMAMA